MNTYATGGATRSGRGAVGSGSTRARWATPPWSSARSYRSAGVTEMAEQLAAEVILEHFADELPDLPRPLLWIEHRPARRRGPGRYALLDFPSYRPRSAGAGFVRRVTLGVPRREYLTPEEVAILTG